MHTDAVGIGKRVALGMMIFLGGQTTAHAMSGDEIYRMAKDAICVVTTTRGGSAVGLGTGFVISTDGLIATNRHVVEGGDGILVKCGNRKTIKARVFASYGETDLAVLESGVRTDQPLTIGGDSPKNAIGSTVFVIGNPEGLDSTITSGMLSGVRDLGSDTFLQISAPISHGSSGGPVISQDGAVIGIATMMLKRGQNLNFALAATHLKTNPAVAARIAYHVPTAGALDTGKTAPAAAEPMELGEVIRAVVNASARNRYAGWDAADQLPIEWETDGLVDGWAGLRRSGKMRISTAGKRMWTLKKTKEEVFWDVDLWGWKNTVSYASIGPQAGCFGSGNSGCSYGFEEALKVAKITYRLMCSTKPPEPTSMYAVETSPGVHGIANVTESCGAGGCSTLLRVYLLNQHNKTTFGMTGPDMSKSQCERSIRQINCEAVRNSPYHGASFKKEQCAGLE